MSALLIQQPHATVIALGLQTLYVRSSPARKSLIGSVVPIRAGRARIRHSSVVGGSVSLRQDVDRLLVGGRHPGGVYDMLEGGTWFDVSYGELVGSVILAACVPIVDRNHCPAAAHVCIDRTDDTKVILVSDPHGYDDRWTDVSGQEAYTTFVPGRFAYVFTQPTFRIHSKEISCPT